MRAIIIETTCLCCQMWRVFVLCLFVICGVLVGETVYSYYNPLSILPAVLTLVVMLAAFTIFYLQFYRLCLPSVGMAKRGFVGPFTVITLWHIGYMALTVLLMAIPFVYFLDERDRSSGILAWPFAFAVASSVSMALPPAYFHENKGLPVRVMVRALKAGLRATPRNFVFLVLCAVPLSLSIITDEFELFDVPLGAIKPLIGVPDWIDLVTMPFQLLAAAAVALLGVRVYEEQQKAEGNE